MYRVLWTPAAAANLEGIARYLETRTPLHTSRIVQTVYTAAQSLATHPLRGHLGRTRGTREINVPRLPYVIVYRAESQTVEIIRILYASMDRA